MTAPEPDRLPRFEVVQSLFRQAIDLPPNERETFVLARAGDDRAVFEEVMALLHSSRVDTAGFGMAVRQSMDAAAAAIDPTFGAANDTALSTATGELLSKLAKAPKLDTERYAIESEIGKGGMGAILCIHDRHLNRRLAMKVLLERGVPRTQEERQRADQLLGRFLEEAQVTSQLDHPGVVPVHELGLDQNGKLYFTMRLVKGRTVSEVFKLARQEQEGWTTTRALEVVLKVCDTMAYAHDKGVLHRDLKPNNVMVGRFGEVYVVDWGLAKVLDRPDRHDLRLRPPKDALPSSIFSSRKVDTAADPAAPLLTMDDDVLGTPHYMSPEQARSEPLDSRADVYAIGAMLYELLTGSAPCDTPGTVVHAYQVVHAIRNGPPLPIESMQRGVPVELVAIVERAMQREAERRYASVTELATDLRAFLEQRVVQAYRTGALAETKLWIRRNRGLAGSLAMAMLILVAGIVAVGLYARENETLLQQSRTSEQKALRQESEALRLRVLADERAEDAKRSANAAAGQARVAEQQASLAEEQRRAADEQRRAAEASKAEAQQLRAEAEAEAKKNRIFADVVTLATAKRTEATLYPAVPEMVPAMEAWLRDVARPLVARLPELEAELGQRLAQATPKSLEQLATASAQSPLIPELQRRRRQLAVEIDPLVADALREQVAALQNEIAVAGIEFADAESAYVHRTLTRLVADLRAFADSGILADVQQRLTAARTAWSGSVDAHRAKWDEAIEAIARSDGTTASPLYDHLQLAPQVGLVPIGMDPVSRLWEFVHLASGSPGEELPPRDPTTQRLQPTERMGIVFVLLPGGTLPAYDTDDVGSKRRQGVRLAAFFLGKFEITQGQWLRLTGSNPSYFAKQAQHAWPVDSVDWTTSERVLRHAGLTLPSELRWEYGIRAGTTSRWWTGDTEPSVEANENIGVKSRSRLRVGSKGANGFGLFDMGGNVWEWCLDTFGSYGTERSGDGLRPPTDQGPESYVYRGGYFGSGTVFAQSSTRRNGPSQRDMYIGLRAARNLRH